MKSITDLPAQDLYPIIFSNLPIQDLFNCRLVNKQFKYFSDHTNGLNKLIIGQPGIDDVYHWFYNNKLIEDQEIISLECFRSVKLLSIFNLDRNLKYLKIYDQQFKLEELSNLINLESLEFGDHYDQQDQQIINLNNLKFFASYNNLSVNLNTPKLEKIQLYDINQIQLDCITESIKHLITKDYDNKMEMFNNLEIIELRDTDQSINENLLIIFKKLKQLKIILDSNEVNYLNEEINNSLTKILNDKMKSRREIDIYLEDIKIENIDKFNELKANEDQLETNCSEYWEFRLNNYDLLDLNLSFIMDLYYDKLEQCVFNIKDNLPSSFFDKFVFLKSAYVSKVNDVDGLNWFLNNLKCFKTLTIESNVLGQIFYDNLPNTITCLFLYNKEEDINYDFILKLSKLIEFYTNVDKDLSNLVYTSFSNLKYFEKLKINSKKKIEITKYGNYFELNDSKKLNLNQLIKKYKKIRSK